MSKIFEIGPHKCTCASIESVALDDMLDGEIVWVLYCDPPWNNMRYWQTLAKKQTGKTQPQISHDQFYDRIVELIRQYVRGYVFIETSLACEDYVLNRIAPVTKDRYSLRVRYSEGPHCVVIGAIGCNQLPDFSDGDDFETLALRRVARPSGIVLDPCCGLGATARATLAAKMYFRGNEYNPQRLMVTMEILGRPGGWVNYERTSG